MERESRNGTQNQQRNRKQRAFHHVLRMLPSARIHAFSRQGGFMLQISALQLAELLAGIGRAQAAMVQGLESELAGVRSGRIIPAVQNVAHLRDHPEPTRWSTCRYECSSRAWGAWGPALRR